MLSSLAAPPQARTADDPMCRLFARLTLAGLPRGGGNGDDIRHARMHACMHALWLPACLECLPGLPACRRASCVLLSAAVGHAHPRPTFAALDSQPWPTHPSRPTCPALQDGHPEHHARQRNQGGPSPGEYSNALLLHCPSDSASMLLLFGRLCRYLLFWREFPDPLVLHSLCSLPCLQGIEDHFLEQWHQKLHTNTTPEDVSICEAYLAFLESGNMDDFW